MDILIYLAEFSIHIFDRLSLGGLEIGRLLYYHKKFLSDNFVKAQRLRVKKRRVYTGLQVGKKDFAPSTVRQHTRPIRFLLALSKESRQVKQLSIAFLLKTLRQCAQKVRIELDYPKMRNLSIKLMR